MTAQLDILLPLPLTARGPAYTCAALAKGMAGQDLSVTVVAPRARGPMASPADVVQALPYWARYVPYKWVRSFATKILEDKFLAHVSKSKTNIHGAYIWPDASASTII